MNCCVNYFLFKSTALSLQRLILLTFVSREHEFKDHSSQSINTEISVFVVKNIDIPMEQNIVSQASRSKASLSLQSLPLVSNFKCNTEKFI